MTPTRTPTRRTALPALLLAALLAAGCSPGGDAGSDASSAGGSTSDGSAATEAAPGGAALDTAATGARPDARSAVARRAVVSTGTVSLESDDVERARFAVQRVVDEAAGEVADEQTGTDEEGVVRRSRLVVRVPSAEFDTVMTALARLESTRLRSAKRVSEDVTTQVIDTAARLRAQQASLERVELLLGRAQRLRDVVAIEAQLTRRQAELDSLEQQRAYLADQTTLATVTVLLERIERPRPRETEEAGFVAGLRAGWDALTGSTVAVLTAVGAVLPFLVVMALVGVPGWLLLRRLGVGRGVSGGTPGRTASTAPAGQGPSTG